MKYACSRCGFRGTWEDCVDHLTGEDVGCTRAFQRDPYVGIVDRWKDRNDPRSFESTSLTDFGGGWA